MSKAEAKDEAAATARAATSSIRVEKSASSKDAPQEKEQQDEEVSDQPGMDVDVDEDEDSVNPGCENCDDFSDDDVATGGGIADLESREAEVEEEVVRFRIAGKGVTDCGNWRLGSQVRLNMRGADGHQPLQSEVFKHKGLAIGLATPAPEKAQQRLGTIT